MTTANNPALQSQASTAAAPYLQAAGVDPSQLFNSSGSTPGALPSGIASQYSTDPLAQSAGMAGPNVKPPGAQTIGPGNNLSAGQSVNPVGITSVTAGSSNQAQPQVPFGNLGQSGVPTDWGNIPSYFRKSMLGQPKVMPFQISPHDF